MKRLLNMIGAVMLITTPVVCGIIAQQNEINQTTMKQNTSEKRLKNKSAKFNADATECLEIGYYETTDEVIKISQMPTTIKKVPTELPREITSLEDAFKGCNFFDQDLSS